MLLNVLTVVPVLVPTTKLVPVTTTDAPLVPAAMAAGLTDTMVGPTTVSGTALETSVPFSTVRLSAPALACGGTVAVMDVALPAVTVNAVAPRLTSEPATNLAPVPVPATKLAPFIVMEVAGAPARIELGLTEETMGAMASMIGKLLATDVVPSTPLTTSIGIGPAVPGIVEIEAVSCVALTNDVDTDAKEVPFHTLTVAPGWNPVPFTVSANALPPTIAKLGLKLAMVALAMLKFISAELTPSTVFTLTGARAAVARYEAGTVAVQRVVVAQDDPPKV